MNTENEVQGSFLYEHGAAVMRLQPYHIGHERMILRMLKECRHVSLVIGSIQERGTDRNPFNYTNRKKMVKNRLQRFMDTKQLWVYGLADIHNDVDWAPYVLDFINDQIHVDTIPPVEAYYCGSDYDGSWFKKHVKNLVMIDRTFQEIPYA